MKLHHERKTYDKASLSLANAADNPFLQCDLWYKEAADLGGFEANAMVISTASLKGLPSSRVVLLKEYSNEGFVFFSNYNSRKGAELALNNQISILFFYEQLQRQIRIEGHVEKVNMELWCLRRAN
jgi:pyridoxamine 5'-phosphate oxidase